MATEVTDMIGSAIEMEPVVVLRGGAALPFLDVCVGHVFFLLFLFVKCGGDKWGE